MLLAVIAALALGQLGLHSGQDLESRAPTHDRAQEIADLLKYLAPGQPAPETIKRLRVRLVSIANESAKSRTTVISALIPVLNDPKEEFNFAEVERWRFAVSLLGELKATDAIDDLVRNIKWTSYEFSRHPQPPVRMALVRMGEAAVVPLLNALSDSNEFVQREASEALSEIGEPSVDGLLNVLDRWAPSARIYAAWALARIGGARVRRAIVTALKVETDEEVRKDLENAVGYIDHVKCLKDSSKCK